MKFDRLSLKLKFGIGFGALLVILAVMGGVGYYSARMNAQIAKDVQSNTLKKEMMLEIQLAIEHRKTGGRDALLGQSTEKFEAGLAEYIQRMDELKPLLTSETGRQLFAKIDEENAVDVNFVKKVIALSQSGDSKSALEIFYGPDMQQNRVDLKKNAVDLTAWYENLKQQALDKQAATNAHVLELLLGLAFAGVLMGAGIAVLITKSVVSAIQGIAGAIESISSNNLMIADLEVSTEDELGNAARGLNKMKNNLRQVILSIGATAENVSEASRELSMTAAQSASSADNQKNQVQQIAAAMMEMTATVRLVTEHSNSAVVSTTTAAESARDGGTIVADALARMHGISDTVRETAANIEQLGARSDEIGRIVGVIDEIATQTNLLALNAAIEAARAGEQGRGFAVVAGEVRRLAERTSSATNEIAAVIQNVQTMTMDAVQQMRTGMAAVEQGLTVTSKAGESIQRIIQESEKVGGMVTQIACAATEQSATTQQVNASMGTINRIAAESADGAQLSAQSCEQLFNLAIGLQNMVVRFKVGEGPAGGAEAKVPMVDWQNAA